MKCSICNRPMTKASATFGRLFIGPTCLRKMVGEMTRTRSIKPVRIDQPELFQGCFFDMQGEADRASMMGATP